MSSLESNHQQEPFISDELSPEMDDAIRQVVEARNPDTELGNRTQYEYGPEMVALGLFAASGLRVAFNKAEDAVFVHEPRGAHETEVQLGQIADVLRYDGDVPLGRIDQLVELNNNSSFGLVEELDLTTTTQVRDFTVQAVCTQLEVSCGEDVLLDFEMPADYTNPDGSYDSYRGLFEFSSVEIPQEVEVTVDDQSTGDDEFSAFGEVLRDSFPQASSDLFEFLSTQPQSVTKAAEIIQQQAPISDNTETVYRDIQVADEYPMFEDLLASNIVNDIDAAADEAANVDDFRELVATDLDEAVAETAEQYDNPHEQQIDTVAPVLGVGVLMMAGSVGYKVLKTRYENHKRDKYKVKLDEAKDDLKVAAELPGVANKYRLTAEAAMNMSVNDDRYDTRKPGYPNFPQPWARSGNIRREQEAIKTYFESGRRPEDTKTAGIAGIATMLGAKAVLKAYAKRKHED